MTHVVHHTDKLTVPNGLEMQSRHVSPMYAVGLCHQTSLVLQVHTDPKRQPH